MGIQLLQGDCREVLKTLAEASIDSCVTDPPYHLMAHKKGGTGEASVNLKMPHGRARIGAGFMNQQWDGGDVAFRPETWAEVLRVLKPGAYLLAFSGTRTYHRMACAIEDAGFEIRDQIGWAFGSGFPKSLDVSKAIDAAAGAERKLTREGVVQRDGYGEDWDTGSSSSRPRRDEPATDAARQWAGWGTALKPAWEPICMARKPLIGTVAANVLAHGTGGLNIDGCRVPTTDKRAASTRGASDSIGTFKTGERTTEQNALGRWPANLILSYPADEYRLRDDVTPDQLEELAGWLRANA